MSVHDLYTQERKDIGVEDVQSGNHFGSSKWGFFRQLNKIEGEIRGIYEVEIV